MKMIYNHYFVNHYVRIICYGLGPSLGTWVLPDSLQGKFNGHFEIWGIVAEAQLYRDC